MKLEFSDDFRRWIRDVKLQLAGYTFMAAAAAAGIAVLAVLIPLIVFLVGLIILAYQGLFIGTVELLPFEIFDIVPEHPFKGAGNV